MGLTPDKGYMAPCANPLGLKGQVLAVMFSKGVCDLFYSAVVLKSDKNLRPLLNINIPLISGKYGLGNHFRPLESVLLMRKSGKKVPYF